VRINVAFGKDGLGLDLPDGFDYRILESRSAAPLADPVAAIEYALDHPTAGGPIAELANGKKSAAISVCDITRPVPNRLILPPLLERLEKAGIPRDGISIFIATGLHRPATEAEIREICGESTASRYRILNHHARELSEHHFMGTTASGTPVYIDERFVAADLHITLGFIEPHLMLGFSGGRKLIAPGLAAQETIKVLHSPKFIRDARSLEGSVDDNPLHHELLEIARMVRHDFLIDVALARSDGQHRVAAVFAGEAEQAHRIGRNFVSKVMLQKLDSPVDAVITTAAGYPLDLTFYQAIKGITGAAQIVRDGGKILILAECAEGLGGDEFSRMVADNPSGSQFLNLIANAPVQIDQWQLEKLGLVTAKVEVLYYVPGVPEKYHSALWGKAFQTPASAIAALTASLREHARIAVIPEGPYVLARTEAAEIAALTS
jgi:lactate racemase